MTYIRLLLFFAAIPVAAYLAVARVRSYAARNQVLDTPNERSSHSRPTPTGGGIGFVMIIVPACGLWAAVAGAAGPPLVMLAGGALLALVGWLDDRRGLSIRIRLMAQALVTLWALANLSEPGVYDPGRSALAQAAPGKAFFFLAMLWLINAYNFMDGIDGLAAGTAVTVALAGAALFSGNPLAAPLLIIALAVAGFLPWNWPPAKIFMGDAGSGFLGFAFAFAWAGTSRSLADFLIWPVLLAVFIVDATLTLLGRFARGEKWYEGHCSHIYQLAGRRWGHKKVSGGLILITLFWLVPGAVLCRVYPSLAPIVAALAYFPLVAAYFILRRRLRAKST